MAKIISVLRLLNMCNFACFFFICCFSLIDFLEYFIPLTLKIAGYYVIVFIQKLRSSVRPSVCLSFCLSVRPSFSASFSLSAGSIFNQFSSNLLWELIFGRSVLGLQMGKFWQISIELWPLMDVRNWFSLSIFGIPLPIFFKLGMINDIVKECSGIADG